jgi:hypothetical protein
MSKTRSSLGWVKKVKKKEKNNAHIRNVDELSHALDALSNCLDLQNRGHDPARQSVEVVCQGNQIAGSHIRCLGCPRLIQEFRWLGDFKHSVRAAQAGAERAAISHHDGRKQVALDNGQLLRDGLRGVCERIQFLDSNQLRRPIVAKLRRLELDRCRQLLETHW